MSFSELHLDVLVQILDHLEVLDLIRFGAVCCYFRSALASFLTTGRRKVKPQIPWLMLSSPDQDSRFFFSLAERKLLRIPLPRLSGHHIVGSSDGFLISTDAAADLHVTNPLTGASIGPLPPTATFPRIAGAVRDSLGHIIKYLVRDDFGTRPDMEKSVDGMRNHYYKRVIVSPRSDAVVVIHGVEYSQRLAFARPGDSSWTPLEHSGIQQLRDVSDIVFHKGMLCAVNFIGGIAMLDLDRPSSPPMGLVDSPCGPSVRLIPWKYNIPCGPSNRLVSGGVEFDIDVFVPLRYYLVESPDVSDLFLVSRRCWGNFPVTARFMVFKLKLDASEYKWEEVKSVGDLAPFLGFNRSMALWSRDFPDELEGDLIYYTEDYHICNIIDKNCVDMGVFDFRDGSISELNLTSELRQKLNQHPPIWFSPVVFP